MGDTFVAVTYNTRRCLGTDGKASPGRVARVLAALDPDVVALQELDLGTARSGGVDQARVIAAALEMESHFHPSFHLEEGSYGNAILTRHPTRLVARGGLPTLPAGRSLEPRGALWVEVTIRGVGLQVLTTHLGLRSRERLLQLDALLGERWLGSPGFAAPALVLGDLNDWRGSQVARRFRHRFRDAHRSAELRGGSRSFPSRWPLLRLDYVFTSADLAVRRSATVRTPLALAASDHLPVLAEIALPAKERP